MQRPAAAKRRKITPGTVRVVKVEQNGTTFAADPELGFRLIDLNLQKGWKVYSTASNTTMTVQPQVL